MRACLIFILWGLWASAAAASLDSLDTQLAKFKQDYAEKESTLTQAQRDLSLVQQRVRDATTDLQTAQTALVEEEEAFKLAQSYALRKKMAIDAKAEAEYKAVVNKKELAADNLQRRQRAESEAIAYVQKLQADVQGLSSAVNRVGHDVAVARFEVMREKFEKETEVIVELRFSCGEEVTTKQCREMGRNAADEKAQKLGAVSLLKSVTEADLARLQVTENKVKEELIALVMRRKQLEPEESVKNGEYYGKWSMWVKGQVPESLRPQAGAVLAGGKISPVMLGELSAKIEHERYETERLNLERERQKRRMREEQERENAAQRERLNLNFPMLSCGDKAIFRTGSQTWYPVWIEYSDSVLEKLTAEYCRDALKKNIDGTTYIQVASFTTEEKAETFANLMQKEVGSGRVGTSLNVSPFPMSSCGDKPSISTQPWYPVWVEYSETTFEIIKNQYCRDAMHRYRSAKSEYYIMVASFSSRSRAEDFAGFMQKVVGSGEIGEK